MNSKSRKYYQVIQETNKQNIIARQMKGKNVGPIQTQNVIYNKNSLNSLPTTINNNTKNLCPSSNNSSSVYPLDDGTRPNNNPHININLDAKLICHRSSTNTNVNSPNLNGNQNHHSNPIVSILNSNLNIHKPASNQRVLANVDVDYVHTHGNSCSPRTQAHTYTYKHAQSKNSINIGNANGKSKDQYSKINPNQKNNNSKNHAISQMQIYTRNYQAFNCNTGSLGFIANCQSNTSVNDHYNQNNSNNNVSTNNYNNGYGSNMQDANMKSNRGYSNIQRTQSKKHVTSLHKGHSNINANPNSTNPTNNVTGQRDNTIRQRQSQSGVVKQRNIKLPKINSYNNNILVNQINIGSHKQQSMPFELNTNGSLGNNSTVLNINKRKYSKSYKKIQTQPCQNYGSDDQFNPNMPAHQPTNTTNRNHKYDSYSYGQMENGPQSHNTININALQTNIRNKVSNKSNQTINSNSKNRSSCKGKLKLNEGCNKNDEKTKINKVNNPIISITAPSPLEASIRNGDRRENRTNNNSTSPSIGSPANEKQSIKQTLLNIVKQKENRHLVSIDQQIEKLDNLTKRYTYLRKDLVSIQEDIITMSFKQREKEKQKQKDRAKRTKQIDLLNCNSITNI